MAEHEKMNEALFMQLVFTFQTAAWQQMGKIKNPLTDKIEQDLNQARFSIDMLDMIRAKTRGNLTETEEQFINKVISELQLNYVVEVDKEQKEKAQEKEKPEEKDQEEKKAEPKAKKPRERSKKSVKKQPQKKSETSKKKK